VAQCPRLAEIGLRVAARYGFALAGGYAVQVHGILDRPSEDVDLLPRGSAETSSSGRHHIGAGRRGAVFCARMGVCVTRLPYAGCGRSRRAASRYAASGTRSRFSLPRMRSAPCWISRADLRVVQMALVLTLPAEELTWCAQPQSCVGLPRLLEIDKAPVE